jgi:hypothetical protein
MLRLLAVLGLVPVLVVAGPGQQGAYAASTFTDPVVASLHWDDMSGIAPPGDDATCSLEGFWETTDAEVAIPRVHGGRCLMGSSFDWLGGENPDVVSALYVTMKTAGDVCSYHTVLEITADDGGTGDDDNMELLNGAAGGVDLEDAIDCGEVTTVCGSIEVDIDNDGLGYYSGNDTCTGMAMGLPEGAPTGGGGVGGCPVFVMSQPLVTDRELTDYPGLPGVQVGGLTATVSLAEGSDFRGDEAIALILWMEDPATGLPIIAQSNEPAYTGGAESFSVDYTVRSDYDDFDTRFDRLLGVQVILETHRGVDRYPEGDDSGRYFNLPGSGGPGSGGAPVGSFSPLLRGPTRSEKYLGGVNWPAACSIYFGQKIAENSGDITSEQGDDEPADDVAIGEPDPGGEDEPDNPDSDPPNDVEASCGFSVLDPSTWAGAGICQLVKIMGRLITAVGRVVDAVVAVGTAIAGLAGDIVGGLLDGLVAAFVPSDGYVEDAVDDVKDSWSDTPFGVLAESVAGLGDALESPADGTCAGPAISLSNPAGGSDIVLHPLDTCSAPASTFATIGRTALRVGIWVGALLAGARFVLAGMGYQLSWGKDGD